MLASEKCRKCLSCENLCEKPGDIVCPRCRIEHPDPPEKIKVLLVDDDMKLLKDLKKKLEATLFFEVTTAYDGQKGYDKLQYFKPKIIIVDTLMPMMNGREFVERVRTSRDQNVKNVPIIVISEKNNMKKFFHGGDIQGFLVKPVALKELFLAMRGLLE